MKGRLHMLLLFKKLTLKVTAIVATVLLITGVALKINKHISNKHENEESTSNSCISSKDNNLNNITSNDQDDISPSSLYFHNLGIDCSSELERYKQKHQSFPIINSICNVQPVVAGN